MCFGTTSSKLEVKKKKNRCLLWNKAYTLMLRGSTPFAKYILLMKNHKNELAVKRVIYRYFSTFDYFEIIKFTFISDIKLNLFIEFV